ncbi:response regulator transcription factor [Kribbella sp. NPDC049174]|uniref:response regulator transcription factor n=1 Tax=Kribbella sp. NPDC049174 TaxID=3364112 RepID=UPI0037234A92
MRQIPDRHPRGHGTPWARSLSAPRPTHRPPTRCRYDVCGVAVLPADTANGSVAVLRLTSVVTTAIELFERIWPDAVPLAGDVLPDDTDLSLREQEMLRLLALGATDEVAAAQLGISVRTVRRMVAQIMNRLGARSRFQAGVKAADRGWLLERAS